MADPGASALNAVRFLVGDTEEIFGTGQLKDAEIQFALDQSGGDTYAAGAICARALAGRYARRVDTRFETVETKYSQLYQQYTALARHLDQQSRLKGKRGLGVPTAGGVSQSEDAAVRADEDRVKPFFSDNLLNNPPPPND